MASLFTFYSSSSFTRWHTCRYHCHSAGFIQLCKHSRTVASYQNLYDRYFNRDGSTARCADSGDDVTDISIFYFAFDDTDNDKY